MDFAEMFYQMECCGDISTRADELNSFIEILLDSEDPNDPIVQQDAADYCGFSLSSLSDADWAYINNHL